MSLQYEQVVDFRLPPNSNRGVNSSEENLDLLKASPSIDWITATTASDKVGYAWYDLFRRQAKGMDRNLAWLRDWSALGYVGQAWEGLKWGYRGDQGYIMIASGALADEIWTDINPSSARVTRFDIAVTISLEEPDLNLVTKHFSSVLGLSKKRKYSIIQNSMGGSTLYVGSRQSQQFGRVYDKGSQMGFSPGKTWRYEVELHKPVSFTLATALYERWRDGTKDWSDLVMYVWQWFDGRGVKPVFDPRGCEIVFEVEQSITTEERRISWLRSQVRPSVARLVKAGRGRDVLDALGIDAHMVQQTLGAEFDTSQDEW